MTFDEFKEDKKTIYAVARAIQIIGEAVKNWKDIAGMRDKVTHQYFAVKLDVVWNTIKDDLPSLKSLMSDILKDFQE